MHRIDLRLSRLFAVATIVFACGFANVAARAQIKEPSAELKNLRALATDFYKSGAYKEALTFSQQALAKTIEEFGENSNQAAIWTYSVGFIADKAGDFDAAVVAFQKSVAVREVVYGPESAGVAQALEELGQAALKGGKTRLARSAFDRVIKIRNDLIPLPNHPFSATAYGRLASVDLAEGQPLAALAGFRKAVSLLEQNDVSMLAREFRQADTARKRFAFVGLAQAAMAASRAPGQDQRQLFAEGFRAAQLAWRTSAAAAIAKMSARLGAGRTPLARDVGEIDTLNRQLEALRTADNNSMKAWNAKLQASKPWRDAAAAMQKIGTARERAGRPYMRRQIELGQEISKISSNCNLGQRPAKAGCEGALERVQKLSQELSELSAKMRALQGDPRDVLAASQRLQAAEQAIPGYAAYKAEQTEIFAQRQKLEARIDALRKSVASRYPAYNALVNPTPVTPARVAEILGPDEVLVLLLSGEQSSYVWAIAKDRQAWAEIKATRKEIAEHVSALRLALDPLIAQRSGQSVPFDVGRAHKLYRLIFGGVRDVLTAKRHLILVPTGPMTSLPPQVLVTEPPAQGVSPQAALARAQWLIRKTAISVLPSVQSLEALRRLAPRSGAARAFIGIGDPDLKGAAPTPQPARGAGAQTVAARARNASASQSFYRGALADVRAVSSLTPLPDTATELRAIAKVLQAGPDDLLLRERAREPIVRQRALDDYRIVHFATHGLVTGELSGLAEPALVLTPPPKASAADDGLLTASEIVTLALDADWVVLSACNTASGDTVGAEALSGLARAFFFAGARALLVSHWSVFSDAAVKLTTTTFAELQRGGASGRGVGRAEALRRAMLVLIEQGKPPAYWAPFVVVGDGGR